MHIPNFKWTVLEYYCELEHYIWRGWSHVLQFLFWGFKIWNSTWIFQNPAQISWSRYFLIWLSVSIIFILQQLCRLDYVIDDIKAIEDQMDTGNWVINRHNTHWSNNYVWYKMILTDSQIMKYWDREIWAGFWKIHVEFQISTPKTKILK